MITIAMKQHAITAFCPLMSWSLEFRAQPTLETWYHSQLVPYWTCATITKAAEQPDADEEAQRQGEKWGEETV